MRISWVRESLKRGTLHWQVIERKAENAAAPIGIMTTAALLFVHYARARGAAAEWLEIKLDFPVSLKRVLTFLLIQIVSTLGQQYFGKVGFLRISVLGVLVSSASTSAASANLVGHEQMQAGVAGIGVVLASIASALVNLPIILRGSSSKEVNRQLSYFTIIVTGFGVLVLLLESHFWPGGSDRTYVDSVASQER